MRFETKKKLVPAIRVVEDGERGDTRRAHFVVDAAEGVRIPVEHEAAVKRADELEKFGDADLSFLVR